MEGLYIFDGRWYWPIFDGFELVRVYLYSFGADDSTDEFDSLLVEFRLGGFKICGRTRA
jgi:hypothetical protein